MENTQPQASQEQEIDLFALAVRLWRNRRLVLRITLGFFILGVLIAVFSAKSYTATTIVVPQTGEKRSSSMAGLAALAGINVNQIGGGGQALSPLVYPNIATSTSFRRELLYMPIRLKGVQEPVMLIDYLTKKEYQKFSLMGTAMKYTVGLPGLILSAVRGDDADEADTQQAVISDSILVLNPQERKAIKAVSGLYSLTLNDKNGYVTITSSMPEAYAAAQVAERVTSQLQHYITTFKLAKVQSNLDFIQGRYNEVKQEYEQVQRRRAAYRDANRATATSSARTEQERLDNQYNLAFSLYSEMASQLEQAKINVKEDTPILTVIDPVTVPLKAAKPQRAIIVAGCTFFGFFVGCGIVLLLGYLLALTGNERYSRWVKE